MCATYQRKVLNLSEINASLMVSLLLWEVIGEHQRCKLLACLFTILENCAEHKPQINNLNYSVHIKREREQNISTLILGETRNAEATSVKVYDSTQVTRKNL